MGDLAPRRLEDDLRLPSPLRPYQWQGVKFLLDRSSALLADEMGLGKTVQVAVALSILFYVPGVNRALVVVPASLRLNWQREISRWAPELSVRRVQGDFRDRTALYNLPINVLVASYEQVRSDKERLMQVGFDVVVLDEAQRIKNANSRLAHSCRSLKRKRAWALTGTPIENSVADLVSVSQFLEPGLLNSAMTRPELLACIAPYFLRRRKPDVLAELPPVIMQDVDLELSGRQEQAYMQLWAARESRLADGSSAGTSSLFALITRLKQLCNFDPVSGTSVKLEALRTVVDELTESSDKLIVFSQYVETLSWIDAHLHRTLPTELFHGGLTEATRDAVLGRFASEPGPRVLLASLRAAGVGLNIQAASSVVLFDRWWNPAVEAQAIHRAHRFGRTRPLHVLRFLVRDTIEDRIAEVLEEKEALFTQYVESVDGSTIHPFTRKELLRVLDLDETTS